MDNRNKTEKSRRQQPVDEMLDIVDESGRPTGEVIARKVAHQKGIAHRTSHVWICRKKQGDWEILLQKRSSSKDSFPGCYDISSAGHIPAGCGFRESAVRELQEELGITAEEDELLQCGDIQIEGKQMFHNELFWDKQISRVFVLFRDQDEFRVQKEEIESVRWMQFEECLQAVRKNLIRHCIRENELEMVQSAIKKQD